MLAERWINSLKKIKYIMKFHPPSEYNAHVLAKGNYTTKYSGKTPAQWKISSSSKIADAAFVLRSSPFFSIVAYEDLSA